MADYIRCRNCDPIYCNGCNIKILETMLDEGKFDCLMDGNRSINQSADVAPVVHGRWIPVKVPNEWDKGQCSECKSIFNSSVWGTNYCPNCGAKMRQEDF